MKTSLPATYYFTLPPVDQRPPNSAFTLELTAIIQDYGDLCYTVSIGQDGTSDCLGVSSGGTVNASFTAVLTEDDDVMGVATLWCGKQCTAGIKYYITGSVRVRLIPLTLFCVG